jgi:hypothetical protein
MSDFRKNVWPTPEEERMHAWRRLSLVVQIVFFVLTLVAIAAFYGLCRLLTIPEVATGVIVLAASVAVAELLIQGARFWRTGVESALWLGGLYAFIFSLPSSGKPEALLVLAAAAGLAGWRVRNALFGILAAVLVVAYLGERQWPWAALAVAIALGLIALAALVAEWQRPSTELLWQMLAIAMPISGYVAYSVRDRAKFVSDAPIVAIFLALAAVFVFVGVRFRLRTALIGAPVLVAIAIVEAHDFIPLSPEAQLIAFGAVAMATAAILLRALRAKTAGFVVGMAKKSELQDVLSVAPVLAPGVGGAAPHTPHPVGSGGEFGGAGASGNY